MEYLIGFLFGVVMQSNDLFKYFVAHPPPCQCLGRIACDSTVQYITRISFFIFFFYACFGFIFFVVALLTSGNCYFPSRSFGMATWEEFANCMRNGNSQLSGVDVFIAFVVVVFVTFFFLYYYLLSLLLLSLLLLLLLLLTYVVYKLRFATTRIATKSFKKALENQEGTLPDIPCK